MTVNYTMFALAAVILFAVYILMWIFVKPVKYLLKSAISGIIGTILLYGCNILTSAMGFSIGINTYTVLSCAFLGIPGFLLVLLTHMLIK